MMNIRSMCGCGLSALTLVVGSAVSSAAIECPCEDPPMGTVMTKSTTNLPGGGKLKVVCTNESEHGNFETYYCTPDGDEHHIGTCIYICGQNYIDYEFDPVTGKLCSIIHYNIDARAVDNPNHQAKVYIYNAKNGTTTTRCYKRNSDGTWTPVGTPTCVPAAEHHPVAKEGDLPKFLGIELAADAGPQTWLQPTVAVEYSATGSRTLSIDSDGIDLTFEPGDVINIQAPPAVLTSLHSSFMVQPGEDDDSATLLVTEDIILSGVTPVARIASVMGHDPVGLSAISATDDELHEILEAVECTDVPVDINPFIAIRLQADMSIAAAPIVADVNGDARVDGVDLATLLSNYGTSNAAGDVNGDGFINSSDLVLLLTGFGASDE